MEPSNPNRQSAITLAAEIGDAVRDPLLILDDEMCVVAANGAYHRKFGSTPTETHGRSLWVIGNGQWSSKALEQPLAAAVTNGKPFEDMKLDMAFEAIGQRVMLITGRKLSFVGSGMPTLALSIVDITAPEAADTNRPSDIAHDHEIAMALQRPMLFKPDEDAFSGLKVQTAYATASDEALVGGDFWDTFAYNERHVALVIGDVMGHGLPSAIFTTELKHTMRAYIREHVYPARILYQMNEFLYQSNRLFREGINTEASDAPVCLALAIVERDTGKGTLATAGMESPILVRANGDIKQTESFGLPLGIEANEEYKQIDFQLEAGDTLILTTDGITEARQGPKFLEAKGLMDLAVSANGGTLKDMADAILNGAIAFAGGKLRDDAALVLVRRTPFSPHIVEDPSVP